MVGEANLNQLYLNELAEAADDTALGRIKLFWWKHYTNGVATKGVEKALDTLDEFMGKGNELFRKSAENYALARGYEKGSSKYVQALNQYLKSNTGKMFERFTGLSLAYALQYSKSDYCVLPFRTDTVKYCHNLEKADFSISVKLGKTWLSAFIDADLIAFNAKNSKANIYMISVKSTLKDRFHNVPFWNLLRKAAINCTFTGIKARNTKLLSKVKYISICTDLAEQQPDFSTETGPRNLLCVDAALLDGAFVSAAHAKGLATSGRGLDNDRKAAFYPLSSFFKLLI